MHAEPLLIERAGVRPAVDLSAYLAPTVTLCGDVRVGPDTCILFGAVITADGGPVIIGAGCVVMENAVLRGTKRHPLRVGDGVLVGPRAHLTGCTVGDHAFLATGATLFNGATVGARAEVRINGVVHVNSKLAEDETVPINWIAAGDPARLFPPDAHDGLWSVQKGLDFPGTVFGIGRTASGGVDTAALTRRYTAAIRRLTADDHIVGSEGAE